MCLCERVPLPAPETLNHGLTPVRQALMLATFGRPREALDGECRTVTNPDLARRIATESVGPFHATGLQPALASLRTIFAAVQAHRPDLAGSAGSAGMLCCRLVRGSRNAISNHAWGTAIDLTVNGVLDPRGDDRVQRGLLELAPYFNSAGWYWGAEFRIEDGMHFEVSAELLADWRATGQLG